MSEQPPSADELRRGIEALSPAKRALLERALQNRRAAASPAIPRRAADEPVPVAFAQWRLWFLEQLRPGTNAWNTPVASRLRGPLDIGALGRALSWLLERHATLRTVFHAPGGVPAPALTPAREIELEVIDAGEPGEAAIAPFVEAEVGRPFDLEHDALLRARILRLGPTDHVFVMVAHHIACDGWSKGLLVRELGAAYDALSSGRVPELEAPALEYADYAVWQRRELSGQRLSELMGWWKARLLGAPPAIEFAGARPRPPRQAFRGAVQWVSVPGELATAALALGREERATPFMTLLAAFTAQLHAYTGREDLLVGSPAAMRTHPELERVVGLFANTLVYRTSVSGHPSFRQLIGRVRDTALGVYEHQDLPFEKIVEAVKPPRDPSRNPLVQVNLRVEGREPELALAGIAAEPIALDPGIARFDLAIELGATDDGYAGYLEYDTALFEPSFAEVFAEDFVRGLRAMVGEPERAISEVAYAVKPPSTTST